jgi:NAD(P)-dependent dehydrogenase (short-subunit alcohol dehydrogenase family)
MVKSFLDKLFGLEDRVAIVNGGGGGLGRSMALGLAQSGAKIAVVDILDDKAKEVAQEIQQLNGFANTYHVDVTDSKSVNTMVEKVFRDFGQIDILVNSAGVGIHKPAQEMTDGDWSRVININLDGTFFCCRAAGMHMINQKKGSIINIASMSGTITNKDSYNAPYCASKGGVKMLTKQLAEQWARYNIRANSISPGYMRTSLAIPIIDKPDFKKYVEQISPMRRAGMPDELMGLVIYMASDASSFLTGEDVIIDGGWTIV